MEPSNPTEAASELLTIEEAATRANVDADHLLDCILNRRTLAAQKVNGVLYIAADELERFLNPQPATPSRPPGATWQAILKLQREVQALAARVAHLEAATR